MDKITKKKKSSSSTHLYSCLHTQREGAPFETINIQLQTQRGASECVAVIVMCYEQQCRCSARHTLVAKCVRLLR